MYTLIDNIPATGKLDNYPSLFNSRFLPVKFKTNRCKSISHEEMQISQRHVHHISTILHTKDLLFEN